MVTDMQRGQALSEALVALALIAILGTAVISVGCLQWGGLEASHAARARAFRYALGDHDKDVSREFSSLGTASLSITRGRHAASFPGPGGAGAAALRRELGVEDRGIVTARASVAMPLHRHHGDHAVLRRHTSLLADAGHASDDQQAQWRIAMSRVAWGSAARGSLAVARQARAGLKNIDQGWARAMPNFDWLMPWSDLVPADRLDHAGRRKGRH